MKNVPSQSVIIKTMPLAQGISQADCEAMSFSCFVSKRLVNALTQLIRAECIGRVAMLGMLSAIPIALVAPSAMASELDVYQVGGADKSNGPAVTLMLSTTASMGGPLTYVKGGTVGLKPEEVNSIRADYPEVTCTHQMYDFTAKITGKPDIAYKLEGCKGSGNKFYYTRLGRVKTALISLLADEIVSPDPEIKASNAIKDVPIKLGFGQYPTLYSSGQIGSIIVPAKPLTVDHRYTLITELVKLKPFGRLATAHAYAEVGAYMLGTKTAEVVNDERYMITGAKSYKSGSYYYFTCNNPDTTYTTVTMKNGRTVKAYFCKSAGGGDLDLSTEANAKAGRDLTIDRYDTGLPSTQKYGSIQELYFKRRDIWAESSYSGYADSSVSTQKPDRLSYQSPITSDQCGTSGIYYMDGGFPEITYTDKAYTSLTLPNVEGLSPASLMNKSFMNEKGSLANNAVTANCNFGQSGVLPNTFILKDTLNQINEVSGWSCIGEYAKALNNVNLHSGKILTAVAGFGERYKSIPYGVAGQDFNCADITDISARNSCKWGDKSSGFGQGGFYNVSSTKQIESSFTSFVDDLLKGYEPQPGDGPSVSIDVTNSTQTRAFAYLPLLQPYPGKSNLVWPGNLKKYKIKNGSLIDKNNRHIFSNVGGQINATSKELWNDTATADGGQVQVAGAYAQLLAPNTTNLSSTRKVFVENNGGSGMTEIKVSGTTPSPAKFSTLGYPRQRSHYLLNFLGYDVPVFNPKGVAITDSDYASKGSLAGSVDPLINITNYVPTSPIRVLGGINNSKPQEILYSYQQTVAADGSVSEAETYYTLFGSMDGALHLIDSADGKEKFAFIPNAVVKDDHNVAALKEGSTKLADGSTNTAGNVAFGVDAPWHVMTKYYRDEATNSITTTLPSGAPTGAEAYVRAYGGLGRGGMGFYGLNITNATSPSWLFKIDSTSSGFTRLGQTWSAPVEAKVKYKTGSGSSATYSTKDVLFISGGYDLCYDNPKFTVSSSESSLPTACQNKAQAAGNAVYMIDAANGNLLWSASSSSNSSGKYTTNDNMKHSIVGEVSVIDTDLDGLVDALYFADLGGQVFRADFDDSKAINDDDVASKPAWAKRVVRILDSSVTGKVVPLRFYQRPVVSAYRIDASNNNVVKGSGAIKYVVSVASGDRNSPINKLDERAANSNPNKVISIWDADLASSDRLTLADSALTTKDIKLTNMIQLGTAAPPSNYKTLLMANKKDAAGNANSNWRGGWYYNLTYFNGSSSQTDVIKSSTGVFSDIVGNSVSYLKAMGQPVIRSGRLYVSTYNRLAYISAGSTCTPAPTGVSEAQEYCLPFGVCDYSDPSADNGFGRGRTYVLGSGLSTATFASVKDGSSETQLVTTEMSESNNGDPDSTTDDDPSTLVKVKDIFYSLYKLIPNQWFERTPAPTPNSSTGAP